MTNQEYRMTEGLAGKWELDYFVERQPIAGVRSPRVLHAAFITFR